MKFTDKAKLDDFLKDKPFFEDKECYCLGSNLNEAAEVVAEIMDFKKKETEQCGNG